jgi:RNA polymerase sigma-70 factor (ECF subfamily)
MAKLLDTYLLYRIRVKGDADAFAQLYDRYVSSIYRFVFLKLPTKEMAEDVTSETFLRCWQFLHQQKQPVQNIRALLYKIARNLVIDLYRKEKDRPSSLELVTFLEDGTSSSVQDVSDDLKGRDLIEARADLSLIYQQMSKLKDDYQDVMSLRLIDGLSFKDIAAILDKEVGHVRVVYHRALKVLHQLLEKT